MFSDQNNPIGLNGNVFYTSKFSSCKGSKYFSTYLRFEVYTSINKVNGKGISNKVKIFKNTIV